MHYSGGMMSKETEKRWLQTAVAAACIVPLSAGLGGMVLGADMLGGGGADMDSHMRYLSGLLFALGLCFLSLIPQIERKGAGMRMLAFIVVTGGLGRLYGLAHELPGLPMQAALAMELGVTPGLCLWQGRVARRFFNG